MKSAKILGFLVVLAWAVTLPAQFKAPPETGQMLKPRKTIEEGFGAWAMSFSPDGKMLAATAGNGFRLWDVATGEMKVEARAGTTPEMHVSAVYWLAYSPDGKTIATASQDKTIKLWDGQTGKYRATLKGHKEKVNCVAFSPDGTTLASASHDATLVLWDVATAGSKAVLDMPKEGSGKVPQEAMWVTYSPDGKTLAIVEGGYGNLRLWDATTGNLKKTMPQEADRVAPGVKVHMLRPVFSPDGKTLAAGASDKVGRLWDVATGKVRAVLQHDYPVLAAVFSPDGRTVATAGEEDSVKLWDSATGKIKATLKEQPYSGAHAAAFSPDGRTIATGSGRSIILWDAP